MNCEIVYTCNSTNNKNVRANELKILRKFEDSLYFEFGDSENNIKKRFYRNIETLDKDYAAIEKIKARLENEVKVEEITKEEVVVSNETKPEEVKVEMFKKVKNKNGKRKIF
jgi:hypothetical protein